MIFVRHRYISVKSKRRAGGSLKGARALAVGSALGHIKYIQHRPGPDRPEGGREFFSDQDDRVDAHEIREMVRDHKGNGVVVHKLTLAPEVNPSDPKEFTREVMDQLGAEKGFDLEWYAVSHQNTDHHHIHMVVMSKDTNGTSVRFNKHDYELMKEYGDRYLERVHTFEYREAKRLREEKQKQKLKERKQQRERERQERIQKGEELPWLNSKIVREQLDPYDKFKQSKDNSNNAKEEKEVIEYDGKQYSKDDTYEKLSGVLRNVRESHDKDKWLPKDDYSRLVKWVENKDRERFAHEPKRQLDFSKARQVELDKNRNSPSNNRYVSPIQQELMRNPIMGLFLTEAAIASEIARMIPLTDQRDRLKENRDDLEAAKRDREQMQHKRKRHEDRKRDEEIINKMEEAIDENKVTRKKIRKDREKERDNRDRDMDFMR